jgi:hypothetical protein
MQQVVPDLAAELSMVLGDGTIGDDDTQLHNPIGAAFIAAHPDWVVTSESDGNRIKISNTCTGALVCKFGEFGVREGKFVGPAGVAVTSDSAFVVVADMRHFPGHQTFFRPAGALEKQGISTTSTRIRYGFRQQLQLAETQIRCASWRSSAPV